MTTRSLRFPILALAVLGGAAAAAGEKPKPDAAKAKTPPPADVLATVGDVRITAAQVEEKAAPRLITLRNQEYETRRQVIDEMISELLLQKEAAARGIPVDELLRQEVDAKVAPVTDAEVKALYESAKGRLQGKTEADVTPDIQNYLRQQKAGQRRAELLKDLRAKAGVRVLLDPPRVAVDAGSLPARGGKDAKVTIVEFSDFQCPYCGKVTPTLKQVEERYGDSIRLFFRDLPLPMHPMAPKAAQAASCANDQGKFWEMHDRLFADQSKLKPEDLKQHASDLGLATDKFNQCLDADLHMPEVKRDMDDANRLGVSGTPAFFINGRFLSGAQPFDAFSRVIEEEMQREGVAVPPQPPAPAPAASAEAAKPPTP